VPTEEGKQVLQLLADGKIDVEQAYRLLRALGDVEEGAGRSARAPFPPFPPTPPTPPNAPGGRGRILRIRVTEAGEQKVNVAIPDRKSTRLNSSHLVISYAVFCLKKKKNCHTACTPSGMQQSSRCTRLLSC